MIIVIKFHNRFKKILKRQISLSKSILPKLNNNILENKLYYIFKCYQLALDYLCIFIFFLFKRKCSTKDLKVKFSNLK